MNCTDRFEKFISPEPNTGCWFWTGTVDEKGYGRFRMSGVLHHAQRASWIIHNGNIPEGMHILHKCDVPGCVNPKHLFVGTNLDNVKDKIRKGRQRAARGSRHHSAILTESEVLSIRKDERIQRVIAAEYGVGRSCIANIQSNLTWRYLL